MNQLKGLHVAESTLDFKFNIKFILHKKQQLQSGILICSCISEYFFKILHSEQ